MMRFGRLLTVLLVLGVAAGCDDRREGQAIVATADERASQAAIDILAKGGSAVDAAITAQLVLGLVEPQSSGIGGGAFLLNWDASAKKISAYDGRETAPAGVRPDLFLNEDGTPMDFMAAVVGGRSVGVPGVVAMLRLAHDAHGKLAWGELFRPAIALAREGFEISPRLAEALGNAPELLDNDETRSYLAMRDESLPAGWTPLPMGAIVKNEAYAHTLEAIAERGPAGLSEGEVAQAIVDAVQGHPNSGTMTLADLAGYKALQRDAICRPYRRFEVCGMPPPTSGGLTTLMILGMLEHFDLGKLQPAGVTAVHLISEASALAFADRDRYMADADKVDVPVTGLLDRSYLASRAGLINPGKASGPASAGVPPGAVYRADGVDGARAGTSHLSIIDRDGNAVSMTSSIEGPFGAHIMAGGFFLNNELTDFSFTPAGTDGVPVANAVAPGKRPRSSMSPTIILDEHGSLHAAVGSPGGSRIIGYVTETLIALMDWKMPMQAAITMPRFLNRNGPLELEENTPIVALQAPLEAMGHRVTVRPAISGLQGVEREDHKVTGGADPRREGKVLTLP